MPPDLARRSVALASTLTRSVALGRLGVTIARARRDGPGREAARRLVAARMGELRGLPQKIGQMLSLAEITSGADLYTPLAESAPPAPATDSFRWIADSLGAPLATHFRHIAREASAASLGQVHRATLHDGREVAVKVQYPDVAGTVDADLAALGVLAAPLTVRRSGFDIAAYRAELGRSLRAELDYTAEAATLRRFAARAGDVPGVITPIPIDGLCTPRVLTMTWVEGETVTAARQWPWTARADAARTLVRVFLRGCFVWRELHADPHAGNLRFLRRGGQAEVGYLDFGCTRALTALESHALWRLARTSADTTDAALADAWADLGFPPEVTDRLRHRLRAVTAILFEPWLTPGPFDAAAWQVADRLAVALGDDRWTFRFAGPASLLFLIRAFQGLVVYARALGVPVDWRRELDELPPPDASAPVAARGPAADAPGPALASETLRVEVVRNGERVVQVSFGAGAVASLAELVPADLATRLADRGIDLDAIAADAVARGGPAGTLVAFDDGTTRVRVWLE